VKSFHDNENEINIRKKKKNIIKCLIKVFVERRGGVGGMINEDIRFEAPGAAFLHFYFWKLIADYYIIC
jgi:hypothetical protein